MSILTNLTLVNAKLESVFRTDAEPSETLQANTGMDATSDVSGDVITCNTPATHGWTDGTGPVQTTGVPPTGLTNGEDYWIIELSTSTFSVAASRADALAGTAISLTPVVGTFAIAKVQSDAFLVIDPDYAPDITVLDRDVVSSSLSESPGSTGRKLGVMTFQTEIKNNDVIDGTIPPAVGVLMRGCAMSQTKYGVTGTSEEETILDDAPIPINSPTGVFTYSKTAGFVGTLPRTVVLRCITGGGDGVATLQIYSPPVGDQVGVLTAAQVVTEASPFVLAETAAITIATGGITTDFVAGDTYVINLAPPGHSYEPVSSGFESLSLEMYFGGLKHAMTGARGTFTADGEAGAFGLFSWTFTGDFVTPIDEALPSSPIYEASVPHQVELANVAAVGGQDFPVVAALTDPIPTEFALCAQAFGFDIGNDVQPRECINGPNSLAGAVVTDRAATASFNPESELVAAHPFWTIMENASRVFFGLRVGTVQGNVVAFHGPYSQYTGISYSERTGIRANDMTLRLAKSTDAGNDELRIVFC